MAEVCTRGVDTGFVALGYAKVAILGRGARHHRVAADFFHRAYAAGPCCAWLAGPWFGILRRDATCRFGRRRELFLE